MNFICFPTDIGGIDLIGPTTGLPVGICGYHQANHKRATHRHYGRKPKQIDFKGAAHRNSFLYGFVFIMEKQN